MPNHVFPIAEAPRSRWLGLLALIGLIMLLPLGVTLAFAGWPTKVEFETANGGITVKGSTYGRTFAPAEIKASEARRISLNEEPAWRPVRRTNGVGLPTYQGGWFALQDGRDVLVFVSDWTRAVLVPTTKEPLLLSPADPDAFLAALRSADTKTPALFPLAPAPEGAWMNQPWWIVPITTMLVVGAGLVWLAWRGSKVAFEVEGDDLRIRGSMYGRTVPRSKLELSGASITAMEGHERFGRMMRLNGVGLPNYLAGWFRPRGGGRALLFVTDPGRVVALPTTDGYTLIVSPAQPEAFLAALKGG